jgi:2-enoate reductase
VIGVGRILDLDMAEKFLQERKADIIYLGKQLVADPETPKKYFEGRPEDIRKCLGCASGCGRPCTINYDMQDAPVPFNPAEKPKSVLVIGGGVAGMEAARIAALKGHKVTLIEKDSQLGGMVSTLALTPMTGEFQNIVDYLTTQLGKLNVDMRVCKEATAADIEELKPDVAILSTGSSTILPEIARGKLGVMTHRQALRRKREIGNKVVIWGLFGVELAIALAEEGKDVILLGRGKESSLASDISMLRQWVVWRKLTDINFARGGLTDIARVKNPEVLYNVEVEDITSDGISIRTGTGGKVTLAYDTLIISQRFGERSCNDSLFDALQEKVAEVYKIGDCLQARGIQEAIFSANEVARKI